MVNNTFSHGKVPFFAKDGGNVISWYSCGPTVYDSAHMGHARTYLTIDILRRILEDYFGYEVFSVMNVTDIDDKIILKSRRAYVLKRFVDEHRGKALDDATRALVGAAWAAQQQRVAKREADVAEKLQARVIKESEAESLRALIAKDRKLADDAVAALAGAKTFEELEAQPGATEALSLFLDERDGATVEGMVDICKRHAAKYEAEFFEDMEALHCRPPEALTRVTEYVDRVIAFIDRIVENGFAYVSNGSVYFDTVAFANHPDHSYGRLKPNATNAANAAAAAAAAAGGAAPATASPAAASAAAENDGELGAQANQSEKKCPADFALWKRSKAGEPFWESKWGPGRPGWHIECSTMASDVIGAELDVHFGGQDLRFPHHENELAQSEAYHGCKQWVRYFLHAGHLDIDGLKMSKSLKNFITIRQALAAGYTARQLRMMVLLAAWDKGMNFSDDTMEHARNADRTFTEFFHMVKFLVRSVPAGAPAVWGDRERALRAALAKAQTAVHRALLDNFDTPTAMGALLELVRRVNEYASGCNAADPARSARVLLVQRCAQFVTKMLRVFGLIGSPADEIGFGAAGDSSSSSSSSSGSGATSSEAVVAPILDAWAQFRTDVRTRARELKDQPLLGLCDAIRDDAMPKLGVRLEDDGVAPWKLSTPEEAMRLVRERRANERAAQVRRLEGRRRAAESDYKQWLGFSAAPEAMFAPAEFTIPARAADGSFVLPTHDAEGKEIGKGRMKKLAKQYENAKKGHEKYLVQAQQDPDFLAKLKDKLDALDAELAKLSLEDN